ncbi:hypothetical protein, partial [Paraburkholderia xenovorans]|uniref:hypothetical protein n=1 Tax=Paraburkholderia xenovorans TaxID=36873 RepID=UPI0038BD756C
IARDGPRFRVPVEAPTGYRRHHQRVEQSTWLGKLKHFLGLRNSHASHKADACMREAMESKWSRSQRAALVSGRRRAPAEPHLQDWLADSK